MRYKISLKKLQTIISKTCFENEGTPYEKSCWLHLKNRFLNCEEFWKYFIVPQTKRIDPTVQDSYERIGFRAGIHEEIVGITSFHYSTFVNSTYAHECLQGSRPSSFMDFYVHLTSACDLAEKFLIQIYLLTFKCRNQKSEILEQLPKERFLAMAEKWYDKNYSKIYDYYLKKGRVFSLRLPTRTHVLDEYFEEEPDAWKQYKQLSQKIREYRNAMLHDVQIMGVLNSDNVLLVPKKEKIHHYQRWHANNKVRQHLEKYKDDFIEPRGQMASDSEHIESLLNDLWRKPIEDMKKLFFEEKNKLLLKKCNIKLT